MFLITLDFFCSSVSARSVGCFLRRAGLLQLDDIINVTLMHFCFLFFNPLWDTDQTQKQVMTMSVWSCSAWRRWQTCSRCKTNIAPPWRGARRRWRKLTSTSEWKAYNKASLNVLTVATLVCLHAQLTGFALCSLTFIADCIESVLFI